MGDGGSRAPAERSVARLSERRKRQNEAKAGGVKPPLQSGVRLVGEWRRVGGDGEGGGFAGSGGRGLGAADGDLYGAGGDVAVA